MSTMAFGAGARVAMIGDSITHGGIHPSYIQQYYVDYFPERQVKIYNLGSGGDTAEGALARFDELISVDPTDAVVMFGVNDINFRIYVEHPDEEQLALREEKRRRHHEATLELVERLTSRGIRVTLASSIGRDELSLPTDTDEPLRSFGATRSLYDLFTKNTEALRSKIVGTVDYLTPIQRLQSELLAVGGPSLFTPDRTHATPLGQKMMARILLAEQGLPVALPTAAAIKAGWQEARLPYGTLERRVAEDQLRSIRWVYPHQAAETEGLDLEGRIAYWQKAIDEKRGLASQAWAETMYRFYVENAHREAEVEAEYMRLTDRLYPSSL